MILLPFRGFYRRQCDEQGKRRKRYIRWFMHSLLINPISDKLSEYSSSSQESLLHKHDGVNSFGCFFHELMIRGDFSGLGRVTRDRFWDNVLMLKTFNF